MDWLKAKKKEDQFFYHKGLPCRHKTTAGWKLLLRCKDGSEQWFPLKDMKESNSVQVYIYSKANGIDDEPEFAWWVPHVLKNLIVLSRKSRLD